MPHMSKRDSIEVIKAHIDTLRALIITLISAIFAVFGYAIINLSRLTSFQITLGSVALTALCVFLAVTTLAYLREIKKLEELK